ncbi:hypothetical protein [Limosilactobacillus caccae]|uniref:hypothetical protein n=1 Tax=Limosilactobacillus caccae TaxID=1926284 RepID=UPI0013564E48|nr:hypothetical protein [Limosilactobacillus caccae]
MEEKHDIISSKFSTKPTSPIKRQWQPHVAAQIEEAGVKLVIFKGASSTARLALAPFIS